MIALQSAHQERIWDYDSEGVMIKESQNKTIEWGSIRRIDVTPYAKLSGHSLVELHGKRDREFRLTILASDSDPNVQLFKEYAEQEAGYNTDPPA